jgi:hypothetical protein
MIELNKEKELTQEIEEAKAKVHEEDEFIKLARIEVKNEAMGNSYVGWFKSPTRKQFKALQKKYKDDAFSLTENLVRQNIVYPNRELFDRFSEYNFGLMMEIGNQLIKFAGFEASSELKNVNFPS